jgi:hypothetical protein
VEEGGDCNDLDSLAAAPDDALCPGACEGTGGSCDTPFQVTCCEVSTAMILPVIAVRVRRRRGAEPAPARRS